MKRKVISFTAGRSILLRVAIGVFVGVLLSVLLLTGLTYITINGGVTENQTGIYLFAIYMLSTLLGGLIGSASSSQKMLQVIGLTTLVYFLILIALGIICYDVAVHNFASGFISTVLGGSFAYLIKLKSQMHRGRTVRRRR